MRSSDGVLPMIVSASRRTDIPALYSRWLGKRIEAGFCTVPNPFNPRQVRRVSLRPEDVDAIVFWTRHARPLLGLLPLLEERGFRFYVHYGITGLGPPLEKHGPSMETATRCFRELARRRPEGSVIWRFDPILLGPAFPAESCVERFAYLAARLEGYAKRVVISFADVYRKTERRVGKLYRWGEELSRTPEDEPEAPRLLASLAEIATGHGMSLESCAEPADYSHLGIQKTKCIDDRLLTELFGPIFESRKDPGQRPDCGCIPSIDIGIPDTCTLGCEYCYATRSHTLAQRRRREHDPDSPSLWGRFHTGNSPTVSAPACGV